MSDEENVTTELSRGGINLLTNILGNPQWYEGKVDLAYLAGKVLVNKLPDLSAETPPGQVVDQQGRPVQPNQAVLKAWLSEPKEVSITQKEGGAIKKCIEFCLKNSSLPINVYVMELMEKFGVTAE